MKRTGSLFDIKFNDDTILWPINMEKKVLTAGHTIG